jgi:hypothetical protein
MTNTKVNTYAKPTLDKYGFKATSFEVCNWVEAGYHDKDISITWQQIAALQQDSMDIEHILWPIYCSNTKQLRIKYTISHFLP